MYVMHFTRPDIDYTVQTLIKFTSNLGVEHWNSLIRVLRYLKGIINVGLRYSTFPVVLEGYSNATWTFDLNDSKSITAWIFTLARAGSLGNQRSRYFSFNHGVRIYSYVFCWRRS